MEKTVSRRTEIRKYLYVSFIIAALAAGLIINAVKANNLSRQLNASSQRALTELDSYVSSINTNLKKGIYANTPTMLETMAQNLARDASGAKNSLSALPLADTHLDNTCKFLSQVGAFITTLNRKAAAGETITEKEREELNSLLNISDKLSEELSSMLLGVQNGTLSFEATDSTLQKSDEQLQSLNTAMSDAEQTVSDYPTLIYDGPFSDHILNQKPKLLEGKEEISKDEAQKIAADFIGADISAVTFSGESEGTVPSYLFSSESSSLAVSKQGGYMLYVLGSSYAGEVKLSAEDAIKKASEFLTSKGFGNMKDSYYSTTDGICTVNFAYVADGVICYPDLIKVSVSLETGGIISFDSRGYIMNHYDREITTPALSEEDAKKSVSPVLTVMSSRRAVIPTDSKSEKSAYEFHCKSRDGSEVLVYIDETTGYEDDILLLLYQDGGILTK